MISLRKGICKVLSAMMIMTLVAKLEALANLVPAAAVIRGGQVLLVLIGRKGQVGGFFSF